MAMAFNVSPLLLIFPYLEMALPIGKWKWPMALQD